MRPAQHSRRRKKNGWRNVRYQISFFSHFYLHSASLFLLSSTLCEVSIFISRFYEMLELMRCWELRFWVSKVSYSSAKYKITVDPAHTTAISLLCKTIAHVNLLMFFSSKKYEWKMNVNPIRQNLTLAETSWASPVQLCTNSKSNYERSSRFMWDLLHCDHFSHFCSAQNDIKS